MAPVLLWANPADAHRSGCHAAHSCPSDSGCYYVGQSTFDTCGSSGSSSSGSSGWSGGTSAGEPYTPVDYTPPPDPILGRASARSGKVTLSVTAEQGSTLRVRNEKSVVLLSARASGRPQTLTFTGMDGTHRYAVTAEDEAGNASLESTFDLAVDSTAPAAAVVSIEPPRDQTSPATLVSFTAETGTNYALRVLRDGQAVDALARDGVVRGGRWFEQMLLGDGPYTVVVGLTDAAGNVGPEARQEMTVTVPAPILVLRRISKLTQRTFRLVAEGPAGASGSLQLTAPGQQPVDVQLTLDDKGSGEVTQDIPDGTWAALGSVTDFLGRPAQARLDDLLVDTVPPALTADWDREAARHGRVLVTFGVVAGEPVTVADAPGGSRTVSTSGRQHIDVQAADGRYNVRLTATDGAGNRTELRLPIVVSHPAAPGSIALGLGFLAGMAYGSYRVIKALWRRRHLVAEWRWRARLRSEHGRINKAYDREVADHHAAVLWAQTARRDHEARHSRWAAERQRLEQRSKTIKHYGGSPFTGAPGVNARTGERLYDHTSRGALVEMRRPGGVDVPTVLEGGQVWITDQRVLFQGHGKRREWSYEKLEHVQHAGAGRTLMKVSNRKKVSGVDYPGGACMQDRLDVALAQQQQRRHDMQVAAERALARHDLSKPELPSAATAPVPPQRPTLPTLGDLKARLGSPPLPVPVPAPGAAPPPKHDRVHSPASGAPG